MPHYLGLAHGHHDSVCTTVKCTFDPPWFNRRDTDNWGDACRRSRSDLEVHLIVVDVAMFTVDENPLSPLAAILRFSHSRTSSPRLAIVLAREYPGNSSHWPIEGPSRAAAWRREACSLVSSPFKLVLPFDMAPHTGAL